MEEEARRAVTGGGACLGAAAAAPCLRGWCGRRQHLEGGLSGAGAVAWGGAGAVQGVVDGRPGVLRRQGPVAALAGGADVGVPLLRELRLSTVDST